MNSKEGRNSSQRNHLESSSSFPLFQSSSNHDHLIGANSSIINQFISHSLTNNKGSLLGALSSISSSSSSTIQDSIKNKSAPKSNSQQPKTIMNESSSSLSPTTTDSNNQSLTSFRISLMVQIQIIQQMEQALKQEKEKLSLLMNQLYQKMLMTSSSTNQISPHHPIEQHQTDDEKPLNLSQSSKSSSNSLHEINSRHLLLENKRQQESMKSQSFGAFPHQAEEASNSIGFQQHLVDLAPKSLPSNDLLLMMNHLMMMNQSNQLQSTSFTNLESKLARNQKKSSSSSSIMAPISSKVSSIGHHHHHNSPPSYSESLIMMNQSSSNGANHHHHHLNLLPNKKRAFSPSPIDYHHHHDMKNDSFLAPNQQQLDSSLNHLMIVKSSAKSAPTNNINLPKYHPFDSTFGANSEFSLSLRKRRKLNQQQSKEDQFFQRHHHDDDNDDGLMMMNQSAGEEGRHLNSNDHHELSPPSCHHQSTTNQMQGTRRRFSDSRNNLDITEGI